MKSPALCLVALGFGLFALAGAPANAAQVDEKEAAAIGVEAYVYGYTPRGSE